MEKRAPNFYRNLGLWMLIGLGIMVLYNNSKKNKKNKKCSYKMELTQKKNVNITTREIIIIINNNNNRFNYHLIFFLQ